MCIQRCTSVAVWATSLVISIAAWTPSSVLTALRFSGCLDYKFSHISLCLDTIKCAYSATLQWLFDYKFSHINRCLTPSSVLTALRFSGCLDYKFSHISLCLDTIKCAYSATLQWLFGLQV
ncbi:hypothetical protein TNCV_2852701 [Trichonephila clavipes]|uniref:Uncharacterized protein n=1 Tax=Trichonephila clavipes TaxID=2585209 RepID=A0A8X6R6E7_TRICX|nr:hypothetical protein TNCV_2852701 [Trichonephila clavipes]